MPRRQKTSPIEGMVHAMSRMPWWACLAVGAVAYVLLHAVSSRPPAVVIDSRHVQGAVMASAARGVAGVLQYVLPILCCAAAFMSFLGRRKRRELLLHATEGGSAAAIDAMSWQDFELLIAEAFRLQGFVVVEKGGASADAGVDIELMKDGAKWLVQVKHGERSRYPSRWCVSWPV